MLRFLQTVHLYVQIVYTYSGNFLEERREDKEKEIKYIFLEKKWSPSNSEWCIENTAINLAFTLSLYIFNASDNFSCTKKIRRIKEKEKKGRKGSPLLPPKLKSLII